MNFTNREKYLLFKLLDFPVHRYLLVNSCGREDTYEKANRHLEISDIIYEFIYCKEIKLSNRHYINRRMIIHDYLANILTDRMDEVIGFPIFEPVDDYNKLALKFKNVIFSHLNEIKKTCEGEDEND